MAVPNMDMANRDAKLGIWPILGLAALLAFGLAYWGRQVLDGDRAETPRVSSPSEAPRRIVSLAPSITETLFALGFGERVAGVTRYCDYPARAAQLPKVGGYYDPNYEAITALEADLAILLPEHEGPAAFFARRGIPTLTVDHLSIGGILESIHRIAEVCGHPQRGEALADEIRRRMARVRRRTADLPRPRVMIVVGRDVDAATVNDVYVAGKSGWYTELINLAGGTNAYQGDLPFPSVSAEGILTINPAVIVEMLGDMDGGGKGGRRVTAAWQTLSKVEAVRQGRIHVIQDDFAVVPGPRFIRLLETLAAALHPDVAWEDGGASRSGGQREGGS